MSSFTVSSSRASYEVVVGYRILNRELSSHSALLVDSNLQIAEEGDPRRISYEATEARKTLGGIEVLLTEMNSLGLTRDSTLAAVGGGVIQDVATLAAAIFKRGIEWAYAPTTMMAMLDSCVGGKSSINVAGIKNLAGNIYPPSKVVIDVSMAETLPLEARLAGYAEAAKICFARGSEELEAFTAMAVPARQFGGFSAAGDSIALVRHVLGVKKWFVETDEFDKRERLLLNFGHTFGHALESALGFAIPHGLAIAIGMEAALRFHPISNSRTNELRQYIDSLASQLPSEFTERLEKPNWDAFSRALAADKKGSSSAIRFVLESKHGGLQIREFPREAAVFRAAQGAMDEALLAFAESCGTES